MARPKKSLDTQEAQGPKASDFVMPASGKVASSDIPEIEVVADVDLSGKSQWAEDMAFANERVTIRLHESNDPNDEPRVPVSVGGERAHPQFGNHLPRGIELQVKRCVVEVLLRAKPINVKTIKTMDHDGNDTAKIVRSVGIKYPFELINPTQRDAEWIKRIRAQV